MEFAEVRPYQPGDDVRTIDWNRTARMGVPFVKQFVEERDLTVFLAIDVSGSLGFGSRAILKRELAAEISALLAFAALSNHDRVGAALLSDRLELFLPPQRRRNQVLRLVHDVLEHPAAGGTDLEKGLGAVLSNLRQRSVLFVVSDFVGTPPVQALQRAAARHDVIVVELADPKDLRPPDVGSPGAARRRDRRGRLLRRTPARRRRARARARRARRAARDDSRARSRSPDARHRPPLHARARGLLRVATQETAPMRARARAAALFCHSRAGGDSRRRRGADPRCDRRRARTARRSPSAIRSSRRSPWSSARPTRTRERPFPTGRKAGAKPKC